ncbi:30S ribosomal protein S18 [Candidatus Daviesbacteria bacterium]|nr:30S ribosomal protein S18 [Candidatus Daviesbacteria bacterium]
MAESTKSKSCHFCDNKVKPIYTDAVTLRRFVSTRGKIVPKLRSGVCSKHQRALAREIKHARHLALLPFTLEV